MSAERDWAVVSAGRASLLLGLVSAAVPLGGLLAGGLIKDDVVGVMVLALMLPVSLFISMVLALIGAALGLFGMRQGLARREWIPGLALASAVVVLQVGVIAYLARGLLRS